MIKQTEKTDSHQFNPVKPLGMWLLLTLASVNPTFGGEAYTGKIIIDGEVYGSSNDGNLVKGNGVMGRDQRTVSDFHGIMARGSVKVAYRHSSEFHVAVIGDQNILPVIKTEVSNGVLVIDSSKSYQPQLPITVELSSPSISEVTLEGSGDISMHDLAEKSLNLTLKGSGSATAEGEVGQITVRISGSGDFNANELVSQQANLQITGSGEINLTVKELLKASITGSGNINYFGHPKKVEPYKSGSGEIQAGD